MLKNLKEDVLRLRAEGLSHSKIKDALGCSISTVRYHLNPKAKARHIAYVKRLRTIEHPLLRKIESFCQKRQKVNPTPKSNRRIKTILSSKIVTFMRKKQEKIKPENEIIKLNEVLNKFGEKPKCYLTGDSIDLEDSKSYQLDHIMPYAKGGTCVLDNLGLTTSEANKSKADLTIDEYLEVCSKVLRNFGYKVTRDTDNLPQ